MKWEWAVGEVILLVLAAYELWSLRKYDRQDGKVRRATRPEPPQT
jgi:hypothetical protein